MPRMFSARALEILQISNEFDRNMKVLLDKSDLCGRMFNVPCAGIAHPVERHLAKVEVASSSLVARSKKLQVSCDTCSFFVIIDLLLSKKPVAYATGFFQWSEWGDLNSRPLGPEPSALPTALHPEISFIIIIRQTGIVKDYLRICPLQPKYN